MLISYGGRVYFVDIVERCYRYGLNYGEIIMVRIVAYRCSLCKKNYRCCSVLVVLCSVLDIVFVFFRL
jgi:hypothetical protein